MYISLFSILLHHFEIYIYMVPNYTQHSAYYFYIWHCTLNPYKYRSISCVFTAIWYTVSCMNTSVIKLLSETHEITERLKKPLTEIIWKTAGKLRGKGQKFSFVYVDLIYLYISKGRFWADYFGHRSMEFRGKVWARDINLWATNI